MSIFESSYTTFENVINKYNMIPPNSKNILIGMSGGKDAGVMGHLFLEYKKRVRPDIDIEILTAPVPYWEHYPEQAEKFLEMNQRQKTIIEEQKISVKRFHEYWNKYFSCVNIPLEHELYKDRILNMKWPCMLCFCTKTKGFHDYIKTQSFADNTVLAFGWTKWDAHYTLLSHLLKSDGTKWHELKKNNPKKYKADCNFLASFFSYPSIELGIPGKKVYRINPLLEFDDTETTALAEELNIPIVKDICGEFHGESFNQDRRFLSGYLELFSKNQKLLNLSTDSILYNYDTLLKFLMHTQILPPQEELDGLAYSCYNSDFSDIYNSLKI